MTQKLALGIDIGGSHITCQLVDLNTNIPLDHTWVRTSVNNAASKSEILQKWADAIKQSSQEFGIQKILGLGFAMPGPFDYEKGIALFDQQVKKFGDLHGVNVRKELSGILNLTEDFPVRFINDASAFAVGEASQGRPSEFNRVLAITLGTGFGSTFIRNKLPVAGENGVPDDGFLYHIPFKNSIADDYFSTRWFLHEYKSRTGKYIKGVKELAELAGSNRTSIEIFEKFGNRLGTFLSPWVKDFGVECLVIGGNIAHSFSIFENSLRAALKMNSLQPEICISALGENAAIIGSARLCDNNYYSQLYD